MPGMNDETPPRPDPYHEAALLHIAFICDVCKAIALESDELEGVPIYPDDGWDIALGNAAREWGWEIWEDDHAISGFSIICPSFARTPPAVGQ
jgi:hypothetical protein